MGAKQEAVVQDMLAAWGGGKTPPDVDRICAAFAEDGYWQLYMPGGPKIEGRENLRAEILRQMSYVQLPECNTFHMTSSDTVVMTEREDFFTKNGVRIRHVLVAVFELNARNEITAWREYFDVMDVAKQGNTDPEKLSGLE
ncbi:MAG: nuclear transport factor 2 family protein [Phenylobacterium sp.]|nr:nuclear transport factor 2 family protein [Phenylobacterium sp.]